MKRLKQIISMVLAAVLLIGSLSLTAVAAETSNAVKIQLDGEFITLKDNAAPILKDGRVYLPFRSLFETLGAEVSWDKNTGIISAAKNGRTVEFTGGQKAMVIKENGSSRMVNTSAAPYIANGRTMLSVRFAGEALGYNIGWDSENKAVVMIDTDKLAKKYEGQFTYIQKMLNMHPELNGNLVNFDATGAVLLAIPAYEDEKASFSEIDMDISGSYEPNVGIYAYTMAYDDDYYAELMGYLADGYQQDEVLGSDELEVAISYSKETGLLYISSPELNEQMGVDRDTNVWIELDKQSSIDLLGYDLVSILEGTFNNENTATTVHEYLVNNLANKELDSIDDYVYYDNQLRDYATSLGDNAFKYNQEEGCYEADNGEIYIEYSLDNFGDMEKYNILYSGYTVLAYLSSTTDYLYVAGEVDLFGITMSGDMFINLQADPEHTLICDPREFDSTATVLPASKLL